jgi:adenylate cyclase class 2
MLEMELKCPVADFEACRRVLGEWGASAGERFQEADHYFNAPDRDFARTDEALRLRRIGSANFVTYKGPKRQVEPKTRTEIEIALAEGEQAAEDFGRLLTHLGYRPVAVVCKLRQIYSLRRDGFDLQVCLDDVDEVGRFVEVEILVEEAHQARGQEVLRLTTTALGLTSAERRSYLEMLLARRQEKSS